MPRSFNLRDPRTAVRAVLGVLLAANLIAVALVLFPPGGSAEDLEKQRAALTAQLRGSQVNLEKSKQHAAAVERGRSQGDGFMNQYFLASRTAFSTLLSELETAAKQTQITPRENAYSTEPVEGSDNLSMLSITAAYEGKYADLMKFVHAIDQSDRLLIIESLSAAPQQGSDKLTVSMKMNTFVREDQHDAGSQ